MGVYVPGQRKVNAFYGGKNKQPVMPDATFVDFREMLDAPDLDVVCISTPITGMRCIPLGGEAG